MCELIFVNLHNRMLNQRALWSLLYMDSRDNPHGTGWYQEANGVFKTELSGFNIINLGRLIAEKIVGTLPVMGHVRLASKGVKVEQKNVHPFEGEHFVLAHNGTLWEKDEKVVNTYGMDSRDSDSLRFLTELEKNYSVEKTMVEMVDKTMENFSGKFAFLIFNKVTKKYYAFRGRTADLHYVFVLDHETKERIGYIVNTQKKDLELAENIITNIIQLSGGHQIDFEVISEFPVETAWELTAKEPVKLGEVKQREVASTSNFLPQTTTGAGTTPTTSNYRRVMDVTKLSKDSTTEEKMHYVANWMKSQCLSPEDIEIISFAVLGLTLAEFSAQDLDMFINDVIPQISIVGKKVRKQVQKVFRLKIPHFYFKKHKIGFPIGVNTQMQIQRFLYEVNRDLEQQKKEKANG